MNRVLLAFFAVFAFTARADGTLKCYQCSTLTNSSCEDPSKDSNLKLVECNAQALTFWHSEKQRNAIFQNIAHLFEIDQPQAISELPNAACTKMNLNIGSKKVIVRSCQTAKTATLDPCQAIRGKLSTNSLGNVPGNLVSMDYCDLCQSDGCNGANGVVPPKIFHLLMGSIGLILFQAFRNCFA